LDGSRTLLTLVDKHQKSLEIRTLVRCVARYSKRNSRVSRQNRQFARCQVPGGANITVDWYRYIRRRDVPQYLLLAGYVLRLWANPRTQCPMKIHWQSRDILETLHCA